MTASPRISCGVLLWRRRGDGALEVLLVHPGGPWFRNKDAGAWSLPKGVPDGGEAPDDLEALERVALRELREETGLTTDAPRRYLGTVRQKGGKTVHAWAAEGDLPAGFALASNTFELEWPPRSGRRQAFPEVDDARFFDVATARVKMNAAQAAFLDRLADALV